MAIPRVFTIPASAPFVPTLVGALRDGTLIEGFPATRDPLALADATLYLPTRRACRLVRDRFLDVTGDNAAILPRILAIGDVDEDEIAFAQAALPAGAALDLPPAIDGLERRLLLAQLVNLWADAPAMHAAGHAPLVAHGPAAALALADDLARLMDDMTTREVPWERLDELVPDQFDQYWQLTLAFLKIAREAWPAMLAERGAIEPAARRDALIKAEAERLAGRPDGPVIAAGSTGSMPATAELIATIAKLPHGAVVLPGLDTDLDDASWELIAGSSDEEHAPAAGHPQFAMLALLKRVGIKRDDVVRLAPTAGPGRDRLMSEVFRPAAATDRWRACVADPGFAAQADAALAGVCAIEAANPEEEALAIAIALREAVEDRDKTAALVTPDRTLARRVLAALARWNITADDSGGEALADTPAGVFARLAAEATIAGLPPVTLLALLKHPFMRLGAPEGAHARAVAALERAVLRGPRPRPGTDGLGNALAALRAELARLRRGERSDLHPSDPRATLTGEDLDAAANLLVELIAAVAPLECLREGPHPFAELAERHSHVVAQLSDDGTDTPAAFVGPDGKALAAALEEIAASSSAETLRVRLGDYAETFAAAVSGRKVPEPPRTGARICVLGVLEARLTTFDRIVLGGLNEGSWPPEVRSDTWLSRPMRLDLGLDLPERRIALSAHDFAQQLGAREVILSRAAKAEGAPTVASRFMQRLAAVAGSRWADVKARGERYVHWARKLDDPIRHTPIAKPAPKPPREARPLALSVTDIEHWLRDPYTIYAKYILRLRELEAVDLEPGAADRGSIIHGALSEFTKTFAAALPADPARELLAIGARHFKAIEDYPEARAFWWPRFERIARWFAAWEQERRAAMKALAAETQGKIDIALDGRTLTLRTRADRIEKLLDGSYAILDYKTGQVPTEKQVRAGVAPQLTLEAAILREGGFPELPAGAVSELVYVSLRGGATAGQAEPIDFKNGDADHHAAQALAKLRTLATRFEDEQQPYRPLVLSMWRSRYGTYDHLARVKEWSVGGEEEEGGGET
jgi:ATP-dependent helicase/nuclease subunit B